VRHDCIDVDDRDPRTSGVIELKTPKIGQFRFFEVEDLIYIIRYVRRDLSKVSMGHTYGLRDLWPSFWVSGSPLAELPDHVVMRRDVR
jgi:hypothetical protein